MKKSNISGCKASRYLYLLLFLSFLCALTTNAQDSLEINIKRLSDTIPTTLPIRVQSLEIVDKGIIDSIYTSNFKLIPSKVNIYDLPYSTKDNYPNYKRLALNTAVLYGAGFLALGVLQLLPEDATQWNRNEITNVPPFKRWWKNVKRGPVWDKDSWIFNYILHPYGGAAYYMSARSLGFNVFYSFLYSASVSTFFWEYGIEAFMEIPSIQDLILTPVMGVLMGEGFYRIKRHIVANHYRLLGSALLGNIIVFLVDPVNEVIGLFAGNPNRGKGKTNTRNSDIAFTPWFRNTNNIKTVGFSIGLSF